MEKDVLFRHYATITKRVSSNISDLTDMLKDMSYGLRDGFVMGERALETIYTSLDSAIKELSVLKDIIKNDVGKKE